MMRDYTEQLISHGRKAQEPTKPRIQYKEVGKSLLVIVVLFLVVYIGYNTYEYLQLPPERITIYGNYNIPKSDIGNTLALQEGVSWISLSPFELSQRLKKIPLVKEAVVHLAAPRQIKVFVTENEASAYLRVSSGIYLLATNLQVIQKVDIPKRVDLPIVTDLKIKEIQVGDYLNQPGLKRAFTLIDLLQNSPVLPLNAVSEILVSDPLNISLVGIPSGIRIYWGFRNYAEKLKSLELALHRLEKTNKIKSIDLRYRHAMAIRYK